jgi:hypothetical protein
MTNPKRMHVITEDEYMQYKRLKDGSPLEAASDGKVFAHGFSCNLCRQVFKSVVTLDNHLKQHAPQVQPSNHSIFVNVVPSEIPVAPKKHKLRKSVLNFDVVNWLTLK